MGGEWQYPSITDADAALPLEPWVQRFMESTTIAQDSEIIDPKMMAALHAGFNAGIAAGMSLAKSGRHWDAAPCGVRPRKQRVPSDSETTGLGSDSSAFVARGRDGCSPQIRQGSSAKDQQRSLQELRNGGPRSYAAQPSSSDGTNAAVESPNCSKLKSSTVTQSPATRQCQVIWCDQRSFKDASLDMREQLEAACGGLVSAHKSAEKCIRLLKKRLQAQARPPCVFLISWANAPMLLPFLCEAPQVVVKVVLLTDMCQSRRQDAAEMLSCLYPFIARVASTWPEAVDAVAEAVKEYQRTQS